MYQMINRNYVKDYTPNDIRNEVLECCDIIEKTLGITVNNRYVVKISTRMTKTLGTCRRNNSHYYTITLSKKHIEHSSAQSVHDTIMHEVLHSLPDCMNHGPVWKSYANKICMKMPNYTIARLSSDETYSRYLKETTKYKYKIICKGCGATWKKQRMSDLIRACAKEGEQFAQDVTAISLKLKKIRSNIMKFEMYAVRSDGKTLSKTFYRKNSISDERKEKLLNNWIDGENDLIEKDRIRGKNYCYVLWGIKELE